ncbi:MAG: hypothetical protein FWG91_05125 [Lachnospiraceae bacterium]|nr:hypothetical protein [Lachnospiraceae bacterium]
MDKLLEENSDMRAIEFYDLLPEGYLFGFPIDDTALAMYPITVGDMKEYMNPTGEHWSSILEEILLKKGLIN